MKRNKIAFFSMDVEDWYHLEYFTNADKNSNPSITEDGLKNYIDLLEKYDIKSTLFLVGTEAEKIKLSIDELLSRGHEFGYHSKNHKLVSKISDELFIEELDYAFNFYTKYNITEIGYRAPCFSLGKSKLEILKNHKSFIYDSSFINQPQHPLYSPLDLSGFKKTNDGIYTKNGFYEFEVSTEKFLGINIPISGGGYIRLLPWFIYKFLLKRYLNNHNTYSFYIHPFETSSIKLALPQGTSILTRIRFNYNRRKVLTRMEKVIKILKKADFKFMTYKDYLNEDIN